MNPVAETLTGWPITHAAGQFVDEVYHSIDERGARARNPALHALEIQDNVPPADNAVFISRNGPECDIEDSGSLIRKADGAVLGAILAFRDITEKNTKSKQLIKYQRHLEELVDERTAALRSRIELESLISAACVSLTKCDPGRLEEGINEAVAKLAEFIGVDHYLVTQAENESILERPLHNLPSGATKSLELLDTILWRENTWIHEQMAAEGHVLVPDVKVLAESFPKTEKVLTSLNMDSILALPLGHDKDGRFWGVDHVYEHFPSGTQPA